MTTIRDVAKRAGVATMTVSRVINNSGYVSDATRAKVEAAVAELGYVPNMLGPSLRSNRTNTLALVLTDSVGILVENKSFLVIGDRIGKWIPMAAISCAIVFAFAVFVDAKQAAAMAGTEVERSLMEDPVECLQPIRPLPL